MMVIGSRNRVSHAVRPPPPPHPHLEFLDAVGEGDELAGADERPVQRVEHLGLGLGLEKRGMGVVTSELGVCFDVDSSEGEKARQGMASGFTADSQASKRRLIV